MKLRIARKMDQRPAWKYPNKRRDTRPWWAVYTCDQLARAERRLKRAWHTACPPFLDDEDRKCRKTNDDFFAMNRVVSRRQRRAALRRVDRKRYR